MHPSLPKSDRQASIVAAASVPQPALQLPETGFLRERQVLAFVPISKSTLWRQVRACAFPAPVKLSAHVTAWRAEDLRRWIQEQGGTHRRPGA
jgi:prophage regulatory protein